jgi:hypothetical protein
MSETEATTGAAPYPETPHSFERYWRVSDWYAPRSASYTPLR